jgi:transporter family-2 protein
MNTSILLVLLALFAGACMPIQAGINARLADWTQSSALAATVSFAVGTLALVAWAAVMRIPLPPLSNIGQTSLWHWSGGVLGAFFVTVTVFLAPKLGAATMLALLVAGQMFASIGIDHFGLIAYEPRPASLLRVLGAALIVAGVVLVRRF